MIDFTALIEALIGVLATLITYKLIPWIIANTNAKQQLILQTVADTAVYAAEQLYKGNGRGQEKLDYALKYMEERGYKADRARIEAAVYNAFPRNNIIHLPCGKADDEPPEPETPADDTESE